MEVIIQKRIQNLKKLGAEEQMSNDWFEKRYNMITASLIAAILNESKYKTQKDVLIAKCSPLSKVETKNTRFGILFEPVAKELYEEMFFEKVTELGCIPHRVYPWLGASPDGVVTSGKLLEIKCPRTRRIRKAVRDYWVQMQIQMEVCDLELCDYFQCQFHQYENQEEFMNDHTVKRKGYFKCDENDAEGGVIYWRLDDYTLETVQRDHRWFRGILPDLKRFWRLVLHYRKVGIDELEKDLGLGLGEEDGSDDNRPRSDSRVGTKKIVKQIQTTWINWDEWVSATQIRAHLLKDPCLDYIQRLQWAEWNKSKALGSHIVADGSEGGIDDIALGLSAGSGDRFFEEDHDEEDKDFYEENQLLLEEWGEESNTFLEKILADGLAFEKEAIRFIQEKNPDLMFRGICLCRDQIHSSSKAQETIEAMKEGVHIIYQGVLRNYSNKTYGLPDLIVRSDVVNRLFEMDVLSEEEAGIAAVHLNGPYHYVIIDIKYATLYLRSDGRHLRNQGNFIPTKGQLYIYNEALGEIQGYIAPKAFVIGKKWIYSVGKNKFEGNNCFERVGIIDYKGHDSGYELMVQDAIAWYSKLQNEFDTMKLFPPSHDELYPNMCNRYDAPWKGVKYKMAVENAEITSVWYCGVVHREHAAKAGIHRWDDPRCNAKMLGIRGKRLAPIIDSILDINRQEKDLIRRIGSGKEGAGTGWKNRDKRGLELFIDFETVNVSSWRVVNGKMCAYDTQIVVMIGCGWERDDGAWEFRSFTANRISLDEEKKIFNRFFQLVIALKRTAGFRAKEYPRMYHWGHIERTLFKKIKERHKGNKWVFNNCVDFCRIMQDEVIVVKGALNFGLKPVSKALWDHGLIKTSWEGATKNASGLDAMIALLKANEQAIQQSVSLKVLDVVKDIEKYNEVDCKVIWEIVRLFREIL